MREIKFRARRIDTGKWVSGYYFTAPLTDENSGTKPEAGWFFLAGNGTRHCIGQDGVSYVVDEKTISQFTGLCDKNGKEIYEGDIVRWNEWVIAYSDSQKKPVKVSSVTWSAKGFWFLSGDSNWHMGIYENIEVIGSIHENPELLK